MRAWASECEDWLARQAGPERRPSKRAGDHFASSKISTALFASEMMSLSFRRPLVNGLSIFPLIFKRLRRFILARKGRCINRRPPRTTITLPRFQTVASELSLIPRKKQPPPLIGTGAAEATARDLTLRARTRINGAPAGYSPERLSPMEWNDTDDVPTFYTQHARMARRHHPSLFRQAD